MGVDVVVVVNGDGDVNGERQRDSAARDTGPMLSFQRLDVYRAAIEFLALAVEVAARVPRGYAHLADQLRRAATSSPLNIAEAAGRTSDAEAARHYAIARGSAMECAAVLDALKVLSAIDQTRYARGMDLLEREVAMLTKLCR
ncbi:four helix bundle protein [Sandaracinus amylolyticus]|uniref:four helix bundle protein n=1 Tax=Sandaracinus amylolyticus TaxID=927083 RepID=UPI001F188F89|nr:four helix bundle protein [Sandaracinus amylolyticus]UJR87202.1 Hypothetical protein I5071_93030 [Sandaracinus amylolyticus]